MLKTVMHAMEMEFATTATADIIITCMVNALNLQATMKIACGKMKTKKNANFAITDTILTTESASESNPLQRH